MINKPLRKFVSGPALCGELQYRGFAKVSLHGPALEEVALVDVVGRLRAGVAADRPVAAPAEEGSADAPEAAETKRLRGVVRT